ncbi:MAG: hypothetical protein SAL07_23895 [Oscillatoria sp. PMC 1051.18]|nr:hypothetical protein [Oscillatoria sp. PMC 1050.18]MEC5032956.1 hypothetical protein [Oscillatoria sp. PMC 1051.18]
MNGEIVRLYHPRRDRWLDHFKLEKGEIIPLTAIGRVTVRLLQINRSERIKERKLLTQANILDVPDS